MRPPFSLTITMYRSILLYNRREQPIKKGALMEKFNHKVNTNTSCFDSVVYHGLYESYLGELMGAVSPDKYADAEKAIGEFVADSITYMLNECVFIPDNMRNDFKFTYVKTYHPRYYNFETDSVELEFAYNDNMYSWMLAYSNINHDEFDRFLADNFTSYDGFDSYTPNNFADWYSGYSMNDFRCVSALLWFAIDNEFNDDSKQTMYEDWIQEVDDYLRAECMGDTYAVRYDNGLTAIVVEDEIANYPCVHYSGYLIDDDNNVIKKIEFLDDNDEMFSAYSVWNNDMMHELSDAAMCHDWVVCNVPKSFYALTACE